MESLPTTLGYFIYHVWVNEENIFFLLHFKKTLISLESRVKLNPKYWATGLVYDITYHMTNHFWSLLFPPLLFFFHPYYFSCLIRYVKNILSNSWAHEDAHFHILSAFIPPLLRSSQSTIAASTMSGQNFEIEKAIYKYIRIYLTQKIDIIEQYMFCFPQLLELIWNYFPDLAINNHCLFAWVFHKYNFDFNTWIFFIGIFFFL